MKKNIFVITLSILGIMGWSISALAVTDICFSPATVNVAPGQNFFVTVTINPQSVANYTVKAEVNYPADFLEVKSFTFGSIWMPISQSGYDLIDNANGVLIKTAGYPGGLSSNALFGNIYFSAKKAGTGIIETVDNSLILDSNNQNVLGSLGQTSVVITAPAQILTPTPTPTPSPTPTPTPTPTPETTIPAEAGQTAGLREIIGTKFFLASLGDVLLRPAAIWIIIILLALVALYFVGRIFYRKK